MIIDRSGASALIPEEVSREIIQSLPTTSIVMQLGRRLPNMTKKTTRMPVLSVLPQAYFVNGDTGLKRTTNMAWSNKFLEAEELAVIVPIPEAVLDDADYDIWGEVRPRLIEALAAKFDAAVLHGENAPSSWPDDILTGATAAGHVVDLSNVEATGDIYDAVLGVDGLLSKVENDGFGVNGHLALNSMKGKYRGLRGEDGHPIFIQTMQQASNYALDGQPIYFVKNEEAVMDNSIALQISGDWNQLVYAIRQDFTFKVLTEATLTDSAGNVILNLPQQDAVALRVVMRVAWQLPNPINGANHNESTRYPFAVLVP